MKPLTIAMVAACPFPANHGTPAAIREMSETLTQLGHQVHVVTYPLKDDIPTNGVIIHRVRRLGKAQQIVVGPTYQRLGFDALMIPKLCQVIRNHKVGVIHAHNYEGALVGYGAKKATGTPMVYNAINTMINELPLYGFIRPQSMAILLAHFLDRVVPRMADFIIADTEELRSFMIEKGVSPEDVRVVHSGVNVEMFEKGDREAIRKRYQIGTNPLVIYTGTLDAFQGIDSLLEAFKIVHGQFPEAMLMILGSTVHPLHEEKYRGMAKEMGLGERVIFTTCMLDALPDFLAAADITVLPRLSSPGIPTKLLNYRAAGKPIISFEGSGKGLQHMVDALVIQSDDRGEFGRAINRLISDPLLAQRLGENAKKGIEGRYDWQTIARKIEGVYFSILGNKGK
jgi:glycosyltransferase involved in cell wall biosynthesis